MADEKFVAGDVVVLKSGSPKMTVTFTNSEVAFVVYYDEATRTMYSDPFKIRHEALKKAP